MMLERFDKLTAQRSHLKAWWENRENVDCVSGGRYKLRVDVQKPTMVAYCGQEYSGAKNYHDCPGFFVEAVRKELQACANKMASSAYEAEMLRLQKLIDECRDSVMSHFQEMDGSK